MRKRENKRKKEAIREKYLGTREKNDSFIKFKRGFRNEAN